MQVEIYIPLNADVSAIVARYPDMERECIDDDDDCDRYWLGKSSDEELEGGEREWLSHDGAVDVCGFVEGAIEGSETLIEGNGGWAQSMISRRDFSGLAVTPSERREYERVSKIYWKAFKAGEDAAKKKPKRGKRHAQPLKP